MIDVNAIKRADGKRRDFYRSKLSMTKKSKKYGNGYCVLLFLYYFPLRIEVNFANNSGEIMPSDEQSSHFLDSHTAISPGPRWAQA